MTLTETLYTKTARLSSSSSEAFSKAYLNKSPSYFRTIKAQGRELNHRNLATLLNNVSQAADFHLQSAQNIPQLKSYAAKWKDWEDELASMFSEHLINELALNDGAKRLVRKHFVQMLT